MSCIDCSQVKYMSKGWSMTKVNSLICQWLYPPILRVHYAAVTTPYDKLALPFTEQKYSLTRCVFIHV